MSTPDLDDDAKEAVATVRTLIGLVKAQLLVEGNAGEGEDGADGPRVEPSCSSSSAEQSRVRVAEALDNLLPELRRIERRIEEDQLNAKDQSDKRPPSSEPEQPSTGSGKSETTHRNKSRFAQWLRNKWKGRRARTTSWCDEVNTWMIDDVGAWLSSISLSQYRENFAAHEVTGKELLKLERSDLKDLGVTKVGHLKRIQSAINELVQGTAGDPKTVGGKKPSRSVERATTEGNEASVSSL
uniref:SAM domain-containing protein n=1 Tax=Plectus sambesii TaxID=2011161 RepID=A0A914VCX3_9BILA